MKRFLFALALTGLAVPADAQQGAWVRPSAAGWLGVTYDVRWVTSADGCAARVLVDDVAQGSPAERAGVRQGDAVIAINGDRSPAVKLRVLPATLASGDSVRLVIERSGAAREIIAIADRRPERPPTAGRSIALVPGASRTSQDLPVIHAHGDRITASNVQAGSVVARSGTRGYWLAADRERPVLRNLPARPRTDMDRRVADLLRCAEEQSRALPTLMPLDVGRVQARAESLRVVIAQRALDHRDPEAREEVFREVLAARVADPVGFPGQIPIRSGDDRPGAVAAMAGADVVVLERELAAYFRGASQGLLVLRVTPDSRAGRGGLKPGDVITAANGTAVADQLALRALLAPPEAGRSEGVDLTVVRQGRRQTLTLPPR